MLKKNSDSDYFDKSGFSKDKSSFRQSFGKLTGSNLKESQGERRKINKEALNKGLKLEDALDEYKRKNKFLFNHTALVPEDYLKHFNYKDSDDEN